MTGVRSVFDGLCHVTFTPLSGCSPVQQNACVELGGQGSRVSSVPAIWACLQPLEWRISERAVAKIKGAQFFSETVESNGDSERIR